jgi:hypothetical protein
MRFRAALLRLVGVQLSAQMVDPRTGRGNRVPPLDRVERQVDPDGKPIRSRHLPRSQRFRLRPTRRLHHAEDAIIPPAKGRYIAEHIPDAKYVELPGRNIYHMVEPGWRASFQEIAQFLTGHQAEVADDRVLATVLFTDIVDSTRRAAEMGDRDWHALLDAHDAVIRAQPARFRGREVNTSGDGFLATFDGPQRAIRCAMAIRDAVQALGIAVRAGLHTGECEVRGDDIGGIGVHIGARERTGRTERRARVQHAARPGIGSGLEFESFACRKRLCTR